MKKTATSSPAKDRAKPASKGTGNGSTSYDTSRKETSTPQKVREEIEPEGEQKRAKKQSE